MKLSLRRRILLTLVPQFGLLAILGGTAAVIVHFLGNSIDTILRENYASIIYMECLKESLDRIDASFTVALTGEADTEARRQYDDEWQPFLENLRAEEGNITVQGEGEAVDRLAQLTERYREKGDAFFGRRPDDPARRKDYSDPQGLHDLSVEIRETADRIRHLNQDNMQKASQDARRTARQSLIGIACGLGSALLLSIWLARRALLAILRPIRDVTQSARAIGGGDLDQVVPVISRDELGDLADEFNAMARQLRMYRQSSYSRLLRAQRTSQATIDSFPDPVLVVDAEWHVEMANPAAQHLFGVRGKGPDEKPLVPWHPPDSLREHLRVAIQGQRPYLPEEFDRAVAIAADRVERYFLPRIVPISDPFGQTLGAAVLLHDVTRFRLLDQVKNDLVSTASHELKTPLTSLRLAVHLLLEEVVGPLNPKQIELLLDARDNAERLLAMVNNLLDLARLERGRQHLDIRPVRPDDLIDAVVDTVRPRAADKGIVLKIEPHHELPPIAADKKQIEHALANLLDNAITYTDRGGEIRMSAARDGDHVGFAVSDTGIGIPPEHLPHVFDRFFRIPGQSRESGTGLGLAIVHEIVTAHGGSVSCVSKPGAGSTFGLALPVWPATANDGAERPVEAAATTVGHAGRREQQRGS